MGFLQHATVSELILTAITFLIAMTVHEFAHAYIAYRMGDTTARDMGRMTLNPFVNINWMGFAMAMVIGFGFLGSAPVNEYRMRDRRWGMFWAVAAGPISNLLLAIVCAIPFWLIPTLIPEFNSSNDFVPTIQSFFGRMVWLNLILFVFNLIPLFPLDGWTILLKLVPPQTSYMLAQYQKESMYIFYGLILLSFALPQFDLLGRIIYPPVYYLIGVLIPQLRFLMGA